MPINYDAATRLLEDVFARVEADFLQGLPPPAFSEEVRAALVAVFASRTQAYREVLVGCTIARIQDKKVNIRLPYVDQGADAFSGRSLDERVVNPLLQARQSLGKNKDKKSLIIDKNITITSRF